jgi:prevent-host-death family protein
MSSHSVAEAKNQLSRLIDRAMEGEEVVITRHGHPVAVIKPARVAPGPIDDAEIEWLNSVRVGDKIPAEDAGATVRRMRDEGWH